MSVLEPYSSYRPAPADWLGPIPAHWQARPLWSMFRRVKDIEHPDEPMLSVFRDYGVVPKASRPNLNVTAENRDIYQLVDPGWLVTNRMKAWQGSVGVSTLRGIVSGHYICFAPDHHEHAAYLNYLFRSVAYIDGYQLISRGVRVGQAEIDNNLYRLLPVLVPPLAEQQAIAAYLDQETAQIDALIGKQEQLIETLRTRRAAVVDTAVLASAPTRVPLRRVADAIDCAHVTAEFVDNDRRFPVASIRECGGESVDLSNCNYTTAAFFELLRAAGRAPRDGDLLFTRNVSVGRVSAVAPGTVPFAVGQETVLLRRKPAVDPAFLRYALTSGEARHTVEAAMMGSTFRRINVSAIRSLPVRVPTLREQRHIAAHLDEQTAKIDAIIVKAERFIELAKERRVALIAAAVTGQIDVRTTTSVGEDA